MNSLSVFNFENTATIRVITNDNGETLFVAKDVATALGYTDTDAAVRSHCKYLKTLKPGELTGLGFANPPPRGLTVIPESDLYRLTMRSKLDSADRFQDWVCEKVLPSIRKTDGYQNKPMSLAELALVNAQALVALEKEQSRLALEQQQLLERQEVTEQRLDQIETATDHFTIMGWWRYAQKRGSLPIAEAAKMGRKATLFCKKHAIIIGEVPDPRFGLTNTYPKWVLE